MIDGSRPPGIGIVAQTPGNSETESGHIAVPMILNILLQFHDEIHLFTRATAVMEFEHSDVHIHKYSKPFADSAWYLRLPGQLIYQFKYSLGLILIRNQISLVIFRGSGFIFPVLISKVLGMHILSRVAGVKYRQERCASESLFEYYWSRFLEELEITIHRLTDILILTTPHVAEFAGIEQFMQRTHVWCHYFFDLDHFSIKQPYGSRELVIGQVAIMSETKGSMSFVEAMSRVEDSVECQTLLVGDGPLEEAIRKRCDEMGLTVEFTGRVPREEVPEQLNRMNLHVLSSVSEGLPKVAIEAMACGTPVAATPVGGLPDLINHGKNGFLLSSNDSEEIADEIIDIINSHDLAKMSQNARDHIEQNYSYHSAVEGYREMIVMNTEFSLQDCPTELTQPIEIP